MLTKAKADCKDPYLSLLSLRRTPLEDIRASPAQVADGSTCENETSNNATNAETLHDL